MRAKTTFKILRWLAVLPGAVLGALAAGTLVGAVYWILKLLAPRGGWPSGPEDVEFMGELLREIVAGVALVGLGVRIAPSHKELVGKLLAALLLLVVGATVVLFPPNAHDTLMLLVGVASAAIYAMKFKDDERGSSA